MDPEHIACWQRIDSRTTTSGRLTPGGRARHNAPVTQPAPYDEFGGHAFFASLVHAFYQGVAADPVVVVHQQSRDPNQPEPNREIP